MNWLLGLASPWGYILVFLLAAGESAAFIGLFLPGEAAMILGGVIVYQGRAELGPMLAVGCLGAIVGDSVGYWIGRRFGPALRKGPLGRRVGEERWDRASAYLRRRGGRAVFFGRFVGVLRALLPALAGSAGIPYRTFLPFSIAGGVTWVTAFVLLGYVAGGSYHIVERWAGRASLVLLALVVIIGLFVLGGRWAAHHVNELRARSARFLERPRVRKQRERYDRQISFLQRRFDPTARYGLYLTAGLVFSTVTAAIFGVVLEDIVASGERPFFDTRLLLFFRDHRTPALNDAMRAITTLGGSAFVAVVLAVATVVAYIRTREPRWAAFFTATTIGAIALPHIVKVLVARPRPDFDPLIEVGGYAFPSGHATAAAAMCCALAFYTASGMSWKARVWIWTAAGAIAFIVGLTRVYLGVHWPTDVIGGLALGAFWTLVTGTATSLLADRRQARG